MNRSGVTSVTIAVDDAHSVRGLLLAPPSARLLCPRAWSGSRMFHPFMDGAAKGLAERGIATLRYQFPYMERGAKRPDPRAADAARPRRRGDRVRRRTFILALGGAAVTWPLAAGAQQPAMPVIGYLNNGSPESDTSRLTGLRRGLNETGYVEGRNFVIEYRWAGKPT
jgi:hypothetical protein